MNCKLIQSGCFYSTKSYVRQLRIMILNCIISQK